MLDYNLGGTVSINREGVVRGIAVATLGYEIFTEYRRSLGQYFLDKGIERGKVMRWLRAS